MYSYIIHVSGQDFEASIWNQVEWNWEKNLDNEILTSEKLDTLRK